MAGTCLLLAALAAEARVELESLFRPARLLVEPGRGLDQGRVGRRPRQGLDVELERLRAPARGQQGGGVAFSGGLLVTQLPHGVGEQVDTQVVHAGGLRCVEHQPGHDEGLHAGIALEALDHGELAVGPRMHDESGERHAAVARHVVGDHDGLGEHLAGGHRQLGRDLADVLEVLAREAREQGDPKKVVVVLAHRPHLPTARRRNRHRRRFGRRSTPGLPSSRRSMAFSTSGTLTIRPTDGHSFANTFNTAYLTYGGGVSGLTIGQTGNTGGVTVGSATTIAGPVTIYGGTIAINAPLTATDNTIKLTGTTITDGASGYLVADKLALLSGAVTLDHPSNSINTLAASGVGAFTYVNAGALTVGTVNPTGITATGDVRIETLSGDVTIAQNVSTTSTTANAVLLNAGKNTAAGTATGGNITLGTSTNTAQEWRLALDDVGAAAGGRAAPGRRAAPPTHRTRPCPRGGRASQPLDGGGGDQLQVALGHRLLDPRRQRRDRLPRTGRRCRLFGQHLDEDSGQAVRLEGALPFQ